MNEKMPGVRAGWTGFVCLIGAILICSAVGCSKATPPSDTAAEFEKGFKDTASNIKEFAKQGVDAEARGDFNTAFRHYRALSNNPELTPEQRNSAQNAMLEMTKQLSKSATNGDAEAAMNMQMYRMSR